MNEDSADFPSLDQFISNRIKMMENKTVFTLFALLNIAGYDEENSPKGMHPVRRLVRKFLSQETPKPLLYRVRTFYRKHQTRARIYAYSVVATATSGPPDFMLTKRWKEIERKQEFRDLSELPILLKEFYKEVPIERIYRDVRDEYKRSMKGYLTVIRDEVSKVIRYCRVGSPAELAGGQHAIVILNLLESYERALSFVWEDTLFSIEGPQLQWGYNPHEFIHNITNPISYNSKHEKGQLTARNLLEAAGTALRTHHHFRNVEAFFDECLVRAVAIRYLNTGSQTQMTRLHNNMMEEYESGYILERFFYEQLEEYEKTTEPLAAYYPLMLRQLDEEKELIRWEWHIKKTVRVTRT